MTDLKPEDLVKLREIAEKATPGEWHAGHFADDDHPCNCDGVVSEVYMGSVATVSASNGLPVSEGGNDSPPPEEAKANLRHIAAFSPSVCLSLLADRARMEKALEEARKVITVVRRNIMVEVIGGNERFQGVPEILAEDIANITTALGASQ